MNYSQLIHDIAKGHADILRSGIEAGEQSAKSEIERLRTINAELLKACKLFIGVLLNKQASESAKKAQYEFLKHLPETWAYLQKAQAAIAKAEGR